MHEDAPSKGIGWSQKEVGFQKEALYPRFRREQRLLEAPALVWRESGGGGGSIPTAGL